MSYIEPDAMDPDLQEDMDPIPQTFHDWVNTSISLCADDHLVIIISSIALCVAMVVV
jgi:hypothetical protein